MPTAYNQTRAHLLEHLLPRQLPGRQPERDRHLLGDLGQARLHRLPRRASGDRDAPPGQHDLREPATPGTTATTVTAATHVDGTIQKPANGCTACHGVLSGQAGAAVANTSATSAPGFSATAVDASGSALTTSRGVGAHLRHLTPTLRTAGLSCTECHGPIPAANDTTHANGTVAVAWGTLASTSGSAPTTSVARPDALLLGDLVPRRQRGALRRHRRHHRLERQRDGELHLLPRQPAGGPRPPGQHRLRDLPRHRLHVSHRHHRHHHRRGARHPHRRDHHDGHAHHLHVLPRHGGSRERRRSGPEPGRRRRRSTRSARPRASGSARTSGT